CQTINKPAAAAAVAGPEARHADQPPDLSLLHCGDEHSRRVGEEPRRFEDDFGPSRKAKRLRDDINSSNRAPYRGHFERIAGSFLDLGRDRVILRAAPASARPEVPASRAVFTVSRPIPLLAPMISTLATVSMLPA